MKWDRASEPRGTTVMVQVAMYNSKDDVKVDKREEQICF